LPDTPPSPPKNSGTISDIANTSSPMPSVIMAKGVPALRVVTKPSSTAKAAPVRPPRSGMRLVGTGIDPSAMRLSACTAMNEASPV
jgi:hypothetical protein